MSTTQQERILIVDTNPLFRESVAQDLQALGYQAVTANTGEQALLLLRKWQQPIDWLYTRATLPVMIDGWILADEYHARHPCRAVVLAVSSPRACTQGEIILEEPKPTAVVQALQNAIKAAGRSQPTITTEMCEQRDAAKSSTNRQMPLPETRPRRSASYSRSAA